jgi:hypothetical protein
VSETAPRVPYSNAVRTGRGYAARQLLIWGLIALMVAVVFLAGPAPFGGVYVGFIIVLFVVNVMRFRRQWRRFVADNSEGIAALARGDLKAARDIFWRWAEGTKLPRASALARHNLGWTLMRQGELQHAIDVLIDNEQRNSGALRAIGMSPTSAVDLALDHALLGDLPAAEKWLAEAAQRSQQLKPPSFAAMQAFTRAVIDCRAERCAEAARMLDERWPEYEAALTGETLRPLRIVRAFAISAAGPRNAGVAETVIAAARPAYPTEYDFLGKAWPEMASFLASHDL